MQEANRVGQPFSELGELSTIEVGLAEPDIVDDRLDASLSGLSELNLDGTVAGSSVDGKAVGFNEDGDVVGASRGHAEGIDVGQSSSQSVISNEKVGEKDVVVKDFDEVVSVASSVGFSKLEDGTLNSALVSDEERTVVDYALRQAVPISKGFGFSGGESQNASENSKNKKLVHLCYGI